MKTFNCMMDRLKLYTLHLAVRDNEDFSILLSCKKYVADMLQKLQNVAVCGAMVELVDTQVLGTCLSRGEGSSPFRPTKTGKKTSFNFFQISYQQNCNRVVNDWTQSLGCIRCIFPLGILFKTIEKSSFISLSN